MSNTECLITKLKGSFENNNLPIYNHVTFDYMGGISVGNTSLYIKTGNENVTVKSTVPFKRTVEGDPDQYEYTIPANGQSPFYFENLGTNKIERFVSISNMYSIKEVFFNGQDSSVNFVPSIENNLEGMLKFAPLEQIGGFFGSGDLSVIPFPSTLKNINFEGRGKSAALDITPLLECPIQKISVNRDPNTASYAGMALSEATKANTTLRVIVYASVRGSITDVPKNIMCLPVGTAAASGSLEDLVSRFNEEGRTERYMALFYINSASNVMYNGKSLKAHLSDGDIPLVQIQSNYSAAILTWDISGNIAFDTSVPLGLEKYTSDYKVTPNWTPYDE